MSYTDNILKEDGWFTGEDKTLNFTVYVAASTQPAIEAGTASTQTITGWSLSYMLKRARTDADSAAVVSRQTGGSGITITTPVAAVVVGAALTENLEEGVYYHELKRTDSGSEAVLCDGEVHLRKAVHNT